VGVEVQDEECRTVFKCGDLMGWEKPVACGVGLRALCGESRWRHESCEEVSGACGEVMLVARALCTEGLDVL
jgi:hypothetical protein